MSMQVVGVVSVLEG